MQAVTNMGSTVCDLFSEMRQQCRKAVDHGSCATIVSSLASQHQQPSSSAWLVGYTGKHLPSAIGPGWLALLSSHD